LKVGRRKRDYRRLMKSMSFRDKFFMKNYVELSLTAKRLQKIFIVSRYIFYITFIIGFFVIGLSALFDIRKLAQYFIIFKALFIEIPLIIVVIVNTYGWFKNSCWKFEMNYKCTGRKK